MRIGVAALGICPEMGGLRQYFQRLFRELLATDMGNSYVFFHTERDREELELIGNDRWREGAIQVTDHGSILPHLMDVDLLFCPFNCLWPRPLPIPSLVQLADIQEVFYPQFFTEEALTYRRKHYAPSTRAADAVITLSEFSRRTIAEHHQIPLEKIFVAPLTADESMFDLVDTLVTQRFNLPERFVFFPANHWLHKNHDALLRALCLLRDEYGLTIPAVCTGAAEENGYPLLEKVAGYGLSDQVKVAGYVSAEEISGLFRRATMLCFPSLFEGFGMPVLEAMAAGCPVVCANVASLPEIAGDAAVMFDPNDYRDIAAAIQRVWNDEDLRVELANRGRERARQFTAQRMAAVHLQAFKHAMNSFLPDSRYVYEHFVLEPLKIGDTKMVNQLSGRLQAIESSLSWRITKPLRWLGCMVRRVKGEG